MDELDQLLDSVIGPEKKKDELDEMLDNVLGPSTIPPPRTIPNDKRFDGLDRGAPLSPVTQNLTQGPATPRQGEDDIDILLNHVIGPPDKRTTPFGMLTEGDTSFPSVGRAETQVSFPGPVKDQSQFDPEGPGYDYDSAQSAGLKPDETGHWPSRNPQTGQLLKGKQHPTWDLLEQGEKEMGYGIHKGPDGKYYSWPTTPEGAFLPQPGISQEEQNQFRKDVIEFRRKVETGEVSKVELYARGIPGPIRNMMKMLALVAVPASLPVGTGITAVGTAIGTGAALGMGYETFDKGITQGRLPTPKEYAISGGIGAAAGLIPYAGGPFAAVVKKLSGFFDTSPQQVNKLLHEVSQEAGITRNEAAGNLVTNLIQEPEGAKYFREFIAESAESGTGGIRGTGPGITNAAPQVEQTTMGEVFEGQRLTGDTRKAFTQEGIAFQAPSVREGYLGSPFQAPETRESIRQRLIKESSPYTRPSKTFANDSTRPAVVRSIENQGRPTGELLREISEVEGTIPHEVLRQAHAQAKRTGKQFKQVLSERLTDNAPTVQGRIDDVIGNRVIFRGAGEAAQAGAAEWERAITDVLPETEINGLLDDLSRPMTERTGHTVSESGKIIPGFQAISEGDQTIANFTENLLNRLDPILRDKQEIPLDDIYKLASELPDSSLARVIASGQVNAKVLNNMAVEVAALKMASKSHLNKLFGMVDDFAAGGKTTADDIYRELGIQMQILDSAGLTGSPAGRLLRTFGEFKAQGEYASIVTKRMRKLFGAKPDGKKMAQLVNDLKLMNPDDRLLALSKVEQAGWLDKYFFFYKNGMLSGPRTWMKNHVGNTLKLISNEIERPLQVAGDYIASGGGLIRPRERFFHESVEAFNSMGNGMLTAIDTFFKRLRGGISGDIAAKYDLRLGKGPRVYTNPFGSGIAGEIIGKPIQILDASDSAFKELNGEIATNTLTYRWARQIAGKNRIAVESQEFVDLLHTLRTDPTDELLAPIGKTVKGMTEEIRKEILESVFQSDIYRGLSETDSAEIAFALKQMSATTRNTVKFMSDPVGTVGEVITQGIRRIPIAGEIVFPFRTAPLNLFRWGFERTLPYGPLISAGKIIARAKAGAPLQVGEELGKAAFGLMFAGSVGYLTYQGTITGGMVPNPKRRGLAKNARSAGDVPYSIKLPNGDSIPYILFEPVGPMIAITADYVELAQEYPLSSSDFWKGIAQSFGNNVTGRSYVESLGTFWDLVNGQWDRAKESLAFQTVGWTVPFSAALRTVGIATDVQRDPHGFTQAIMSHLPILREQVPPMLDRWGEEIASPDTTYYRALKSLGMEDETILDAAQRVGVALAPLPSWEEKKTDPANQAMLAIVNKIEPDEPAIFGPPTYNKTFRFYTNEQFTAYQKLVGQREKQFVTSLVNELGGPNGVRFEQIISNRTSRADFVRRMNNRFTAIRKQAKMEVFGRE